MALEYQSQVLPVGADAVQLSVRSYHLVPSMSLGLKKFISIMLNNSIFYSFNAIF